MDMYRVATEATSLAKGERRDLPLRYPPNVERSTSPRPKDIDPPPVTVRRLKTLEEVGREGVTVQVDGFPERKVHW